MKSAHLGPIQLDLCFPCSGVWFDCDELQQLVQAGPAVIRKLGQRLYASRENVLGAQTRRCPVCWVPLTAHEFPSMRGIFLDHCVLCQGFWVPLSTLGEVLQRLEAATSTRDLPPRGPVSPAPPIVPREEPAPVTTAAATTSRPLTPTGVTVPSSPVPARHVPPAPPLKPAPAPQPAAAGAKCLSCGETNAADAAVCWACGGFMRPEGAGDCPGCAAHLQREECDGLEVGYCVGCGGVWLESDRLTELRSKSGIYQEEMLDRMRAKIAGTPPLGEQLACPKCRAHLLPEDLGILSAEPIMTCPKCWGSYLENGRLGEILFGRFV
jgi:Zn-finger nucleic acid-binding protein